MNFSTLTSVSKKILIIVVLLNLAALVIYGFVFFEIKTKSEFYSVLINELKTQNQKEDELKIINNSLKETEQERLKINSYFIQNNESGVVYFMEDVESLAEYSGVNLKVNSLLIKESDDKESAVETLKLNLDVDGEWSNFVYFIKLLELMPYDVSLDKVFLEKNDKDDGNWEGSLSISVLKLSE